MDTCRVCDACGSMWWSEGGGRRNKKAARTVGSPAACMKGWQAGKDYFFVLSSFILSCFMASSFFI